MALPKLVNRSNKGRKILGAAGSAAVAAAVVTGAVIYPGFNTADVDLNDGSVWVTNRSVNMVGHLNAQSKVLDGGFTATSTGFDVLQHEGTVFMDNDSGTLINQVDVPNMALTSDTALSGSKKLTLGSNLLVMADSGAGKVWALPSSTAASFNDKTSKPIASKINNVQATVAMPVIDDVSKVFVLDPRASSLTESKVDTNGMVLESKASQIEGLADTGKLQLSTVGDKPVVLDPGTGTLYLPDNKQVTVPNGKDSMLQQRSENGDSVAVETATGLFVQPLNGGQGKSVDAGATGKAIAPVQQDGCVHSAWAGSNRYLHYCAGQDNKPVSIPKASGQSSLVFRKNRDVVVLNDMNGGDVWLVNQNLLLVNNWDDLIAQQKKADDADKESSDPNVVNTLPDRTKPNRKPDANPDQFGVRAGTTTLLPVLFNDSDPDGDVLTVAQAPDSIATGTIETVYGGTGLQISVPANTPAGSQSFSYTADDGRGGKATASVTVKVVAETENTPPSSMRATTMVLAQGESITQNVLSDMIDPDGDNLFLVGAKASDKSGEVKFTPDGQLTYTDNGQGSGIMQVTVQVSDEREVAAKIIKINVKPGGGIPPVANADYSRVVVGQTALIEPLKNDQDPNGGELRLASISAPSIGKNSAIKDNNSFSFTADKIGTVYMPYQVTNGPQSSTGLVRVDIVAPGQNAPIAVKDNGLLPSGGTALVDVLGNDTDPAGGVLVVKSVEVPANSGLTAAVLDHNVIKLTDFNDPGRPVTIKYTVSNGQGTATGLISVIRIPSASTLQPPVAKEDTVTVRVNDVARIKVLANDYDPNGDVLKRPEITQRPSNDQGKLWVDQDDLRFLAGNIPGSFSAVYKITNKSGQSVSAPVTINVVAADPERNLPPAPKTVEGRVIAGAATRIFIPLDGIDPDGDSSQLVGVDTAPSMGTAVASNGFITYTAAGTSAGTDTFTYKVKDRLGATAVGTVEVGIAKADSVNHPPQASDDFISMRPGRDVAIDAILNDSDPDGNPLRLDPKGFNGPAEMKAKVSKLGRAIVTSPVEPGQYTMGYTVLDSVGSSDRANIRMTVTPDAPLLAPIARDDTVTTQDAMGKNTVTVPVLKNDDDPDGVAENLKVTLAKANPNVSVQTDGSLQIQLTAAAQMVAYTVTDQDKLNSTAIVWVPGLGQQYPVLAKNDVIRVQAGQTASLKISDYVKVRDAKSPRITQVDKIKLVGASNSGVLSSDGGTIIYKANANFYGPGSITFEVTDGKGPDDPQGLKSTLTVMTQVTPAPAKNLPPKLQGSALTVAQLESAEINLAPLASDPEKDALKFSMAGGNSGGLKAELNGTVLKVSAGRDAPLGSSQSVAIEVNDGKNPAVKAAVTVAVTSSTKPLPVANDDSVADAHAGRTENVPVLANDVNPFPDTPLQIVDAKLVTGGSGIRFQPSGGNISVTAPESYTGSVVVSYTVQDKTKDPARRVTGKVTLNVKGKPAVPSAPRVQDVKSKQVMLQWSAPASNGSPITGYTVKKSDGGTQECATNTCLITGLINAKPYTFSVSAKNAVGESAFSPSSAKATPDQQPDAPAAPVVVRGDKQLDVSWVTPVGEYSAVKTFNVRISPAAAGQNPQKTGVKGNKLTWTGLTNGVEYTFQVQAVNSAPNPSTWGAVSQKGKPAGKPFTPGAPSTTLVDTVGAQNQVRVDWVQPNLNGGILKNYTLHTYADGALRSSINTTGTSSTVSLPNGTAQYTFRVVATTEVAASDQSDASAPRRSVSKPGIVGNVSAAPAQTGSSGGMVKVNFTPLSGAATGGSTASELTYTATNITTGASLAVSPGSLVPARNGVANRVTITARSSAFAQSGDASAASAPVIPYGRPGKPSINAQNGAQDSQSISYSWNAPSGDVDSVQIQIKVPGGEWQNVPSSGSKNYDTGGWEKSATIKVRSLNSIGNAGEVNEDTAKSGAKTPPPPPKSTVTAKTNTCTQAPGQGDIYSDGPPKTCGDVVGGTSAKWPWLRPSDGAVEVTKCGSPWGTSGWYYVVSGPTQGRWARADTVTPADGNSVVC